MFGTLELTEILNDNYILGKNIVGKREIAHTSKFSSFPTMTSKDLYCRNAKQGFVLERVRLIVLCGYVRTL